MSTGVAEDADDPIVVKVGDVGYHLSVVQVALDADRSIYEAQGDDMQPLMEQVIERFVNLGVVENKLQEQQQNSFTEEELARFKTYAQNEYEQVRQQLTAKIAESGDDATEEKISEWLTEQGYSLDSLYFEAQVSQRYQRMLDLYCSLIAVTQEEVEAYYQEHFVAVDKARYAENLPLFEEESLLGGSECFYQPEGYRSIKQILLPYPKEVQKALSALEKEINKVTQRLEQAKNDILDATINDGDVDAAVTAYKAIESELVQIKAKGDEITAGALPLMSDSLSDIQQRLQAGETFESLMRSYGTDPDMQDPAAQGYLVHAKSVILILR